VKIFRRIFRRKSSLAYGCLLWWALCGFPVPASAQLQQFQPKVISITVSNVGSQSVSESLVRANIRVKEGENYNAVSINEDIKNLTRDRAKVLFRRDFWDRVHADTLYDGVAYQLSDFAYHSGAETAVRYLQRALDVADDGHWGPVSQAAADASTEADVIMRLCAERLDFMTRLKNWPHAGKGWARRIAQNLRYGALDS